MNDGKTTLIRVTSIFAASAERVFDAWLDPVLARKFLFVTAAGTMQRVEIDAKVGGCFLIVEKREAGDASHYGVYLEIDGRDASSSPSRSKNSIPPRRA